MNYSYKIKACTLRLFLLHYNFCYGLYEKNKENKWMYKKNNAILLKENDSQKVSCFGWGLHSLGASCLLLLFVQPVLRLSFVCDSSLCNKSLNGIGCILVIIIYKWKVAKCLCYFAVKSPSCSNYSIAHLLKFCSCHGLQPLFSSVWL